MHLFTSTALISNSIITLLVFLKLLPVLDNVKFWTIFSAACVRKCEVYRISKQVGEEDKV